MPDYVRHSGCGLRHGLFHRQAPVANRRIAQARSGRPQQTADRSPRDAQRVLRQLLARHPV